jgi:MFS family permease
VFSSIFFFHFALLSISLIQGWVIFDLTNSPNILGFILGSISVFSLSLILIGGVLSDIYEKKKVVLIVSLCIGIPVLLLSVIFQFITIKVEHIVFISIIAVMWTLFAASFEAFIPVIVKKNELIKANSLIELNFGFAGLFSPLITSFIYKNYGIPATYFFVACLFLICGLLIIFVSKTGSLSSKNITVFNLVKVSIKEFDDTLKFIKTSPVLIFSLFVLLVTCMFCWSLTQMFPVLIKDHLNLNVDSLAYLHMGATASIVVSGLIFSVVKIRLDSNLIIAILITGILLPVLMFFVGYSNNYFQTLIFYILCTLLGSSNHIFVKSIIHLRAPANYRGKILSLMEVTSSSISSSALFVGPLVGWIGITNAFVTLCSLAFILVGLGFLFYYKFNDNELENFIST